jgi:transcription-repair coupling factor (superfamily II helicase)
VQRFSAPEGQEPVLDKLSSTRWLKTRQKVKESVASLAGDLIKLYATRSVAKGWRYEPFGAEDERFADGFPFDETPDQLKAIMESIGDMAGERPMDRLVCGDVGFGKTEVAIRAAFKCVQHGRQVAVLVPTTILVEQHLRNFQERFAGWPVNVGALSRFYKPQDNHITVERIASGDMDIIIGTHKLLQKEVKFRDLGLLIIDEEHRFGVQQKEKLKQLRSKIDVLTLTATPIPRTLHMSLLGIRDISVITTPPVDRKVIRTYLAHEDKGVVRDALMRELQRKGQCFFVHNRVQSIEMITSELKALVPEARIEFAHGQMKETELEGIVKRFIEQKIDVLVCTTIVESGLDVPNANTIIIDRAHTYGLAQLYQLRGRVGRGTRQAYAYFLIPPAKRLGGEAQERLKVLQSLDDLGMGFNLALRDMEIRGAGNLLGKEQSGNIVSVGFDLYTQILGEAVSHLKGEEIDVSESIDPEVKLGVSAFVPDYYIPDVSERLVLYQRLASVRTSAEADELRQEMEDRFGPLPREASDLVEVMRFRGLLRTHGVVKGEVSKGRLFLSFSPDAHVDIAKILELTKKYPDRYRFGKNLTLSFPLPSEEVEPAELYKPTRSLLEKLRRSSESEKQLAETVSF